MRGNWQRHFEAWFWRWAKRRARPAKAVTLRHRAIYVVPSRAGLGFLLAVLLLWLLGTNYQNNLILAASFFLASVFVVVIVHGFRNLVGLQLTTGASRRVHAGEPLPLTLLISARPNASAGRLMIAGEPGRSILTDVPAATQVAISVPVPTHARGWFTPKRILVQSYYPLGLIKAWAWVRFDTRYLIYPQARPISAWQAQGADRAGQNRPLSQGDDFVGFKRYQPGVSLAHVAWKHYARGAGLHSKRFAGVEPDPLWLDYHGLPGDTETRLSYLCYLAHQWQQAGRLYGVLLPGQTIQPSVGEAHLDKVLQALALFTPSGAQP
jgi:uncharacterized protein (DUF58 family)